MRILKAVGGGVVAAVVVGIAYVWIVAWIVRRMHPEAQRGMVAVGGLPMLLVMIIGFAVAFIWMMRR